MKPAPFWAVALPYEPWPLQNLDEFRVEHGAFAGEENGEPLLPTPSLVLVGHEWTRPCGLVTDWRDRPEALYGRVELEDTDLNNDARIAWNHVLHSCDSVFSISWVILADLTGDRVEGEKVGFGRSRLPATRAMLLELSVSTHRGRYRETRALTDDEAERMLAGERLDLRPVSVSLADKREMALA